MSVSSASDVSPCVELVAPDNGCLLACENRFCPAARQTWTATTAIRAPPIPASSTVRARTGLPAPARLVR
jgi:hypothetical protein